MLHPAQTRIVPVIAELLRRVRKCRTLHDYDQAQRSIFQELYRAETRLGEVQRCVKRLTRGQSLPQAAPALPDGADPSNLRHWELEAIVAKRICKQIRATGDALAWKAAAYDRTFFVALSNNDSPGPMAHKAGLPYEIGAVEELIEQRKHFGLLHDLTNCLRIADVTEFTSDHRKLLHEIKKDPKAKKSAQVQRIIDAVAAVMDGGPLPNTPNSGIVVPRNRCTTHIGRFSTAIAESASTPVVGKAIPGSRVLMVANHRSAVMQGLAPTDLQATYRTVQGRMLDTAGISKLQMSMSLTSLQLNDNYVRTAIPYGLFPIAADDAALLICDFITVEILFAPEALVHALRRAGVSADLGVQPHLPLKDDSPLIVTHHGRRGMTMTQQSMVGPLVEHLEINSWAAALADVLLRAQSPRHPVPSFMTTRVWR